MAVESTACTRAAEKLITHQLDLAVFGNLVGTKTSTNQKLDEVEFLDIYSSCRLSFVCCCCEGSY